MSHPSQRAHSLIIRTPEGIAFPLLLASPITRFMAYVIDIACIGAVVSALSGIFYVLGALDADLAKASSILAYFVIQIGYGIAAEWYWRGQTIGKRLLRLRVMDVQGLRLRSSQIVLRNLLRFVDMLPAFYMVGGAVCLLSGRAQRLGDLAANTIVVRNPRVFQPDLEQLLAGKYNSLRCYPHLEARLRQRVSPHEASLALRALVRRDEFDPSARLELFEQLAAHFRALVEFPPEATEAMPAEQYVRNVVDILFRPRVQ